MRVLAIALVAAVIVGCAITPVASYKPGSGDVGPFILQQALAYGGRPVTTNDLPAIRGKWSFIQDEYGVGLRLPASSFADVQAFLRRAFGPPSSHAGWALRDVGVAIFLIQHEDETLVGIHPPLPRGKMEGGLLKTIKMAP